MTILIGLIGTVLVMSGALGFRIWQSRQNEKQKTSGIKKEIEKPTKDAAKKVQVEKFYENGHFVTAFGWAWKGLVLYLLIIFIVMPLYKDYMMADKRRSESGLALAKAKMQKICSPLKILKASKDWTSAPYYPPGCILAGDTPVNKECYWAKNAINDSVMVVPEEHPGIIANANSYRSCTNEVAEIYLLYQPRP